MKKIKTFEHYISEDLTDDYIGHQDRLLTTKMSPEELKKEKEELENKISNNSTFVGHVPMSLNRINLIKKWRKRVKEIDEILNNETK